MNQILSTQDKEEVKESNVKNIVKVFCIIIAVFAILLIALGVFSFIKNKKWQNTVNSNLPQVTIETKNGEADVKVTHTKSLKKFIYYWNKGEKTVVNLDNKTEMEKVLVVPTEDCTLNITIVDVDGIQSKFKREFKYDPNADIAAPEIKVSAAAGKIVIDVTDNDKLDYITYRWNDDEPTKVQAEGEDLSKISQSVDVIKGTNKLKVYAIDKSGNTKEFEEDVIGASKPKVDVKRSGAELIIKVTDEEEVTKVVYNLNGTTKTVENTTENKKEFEFRVTLKEGANVIALQAYNKAGLHSTFAGKSTL